MFDYNQKYFRKYIELQEECREFRLNGKMTRGNLRVEWRENQLKVHVFIQNLLKREYEVCLIVKEGKGYYGIKMGDLKVNEYGRTEERMIVSQKKLKQQNVKMCDIQLITIKHENKFVLSAYPSEVINFKNNYLGYLMDKRKIKIKEIKEEIKIEEIEEVEEVVEVEEVEEIVEVEEVEEIVEVEEVEEVVEVEEVEEVVEVEEVEEVVEVEEVEEVVEVEEVEEEVEVEEVEEVVEVEAVEEVEEVVEVEVEEVQQKALKQRSAENTSNTKVQLFQKALEIFPFEKKQSNEKWIKIEPKDIHELPMEYWDIAKNQFLLNEYFRYRHLVLGEIDDVLDYKKYVIGIPAKHHRSSRNEANSYGFNKFRPCRDVEILMGEYGYWLYEIL